MLSSSQSDSKSTTRSNEDDNKNIKAFKSTRRTGRRNVLSDIRDSHAETGISDVPDRFGELSTETGSNFPFVIEFIQYYSIKLI